MRGFEFFRAIGSPRLIVAPMVDNSDLPFRLLCRRYGAQLCYTPMISSEIFNKHVNLRDKAFQECNEDRPVIVQFCGDSPELLVSAAKMVEGKCDAVDLNFGCPQGIARKGHYGAYLLEEPEVIRSIVRAMSDNVNLPITCKIRVRNTLQETLEIVQILLESGASMITVHGRKCAEKGEHILSCNWDWIREIVQYVDKRIPIIANGGIESVSDIESCMQYTGCDGIMVSEAILDFPAFFQNAANPNSNLTPNLSFQTQLALEYLSLFQQHSYETHDPRFKFAKHHLNKILHRFIEAVVVVEIKHFNAPKAIRMKYRMQISKLRTMAQLNDFVISFEQIVKSYEEYNVHEIASGLSWYRRYRDEEGELRADRRKRQQLSQQLQIANTTRIEQEEHFAPDDDDDDDDV